MSCALTIAACALLCYLGNAIQSAGHYSGKGIGPDAIQPGQLILNSSIGLACLAGLYPLLGLAAAACLAGAVVQVGSVVFQGYINVDFGRPFIDLNERGTYDLFGHTVPKLWAGWRRYVQLASVPVLVYLSLTL